MLMWVGVGLVLLLTNGVREASAQGADVCNRTLEVQNAIVAASGVSTCAQVTSRDLREITSLDLSNQGLTALQADDVDGLVRLDSLDLSNNLLASLPSGIFDELYLLTTLRLHGNSLTTLRTDVFDQLFLLERLTLNGNNFTSLPAGLFDEFSRFDGMQANGDPPDNSGPYPRIRRFLDRHNVTSPEQFIAALPALYKERFVMVYESGAPVHEYVSGDHPRVISVGADGQFTFSWSTNPSAPAPFRESVEFLRQGESEWAAGIIDFSGSAPEISEPDSCTSCHGSLNKPLWDQWGRWSGSEFTASGNREVREAWAAYMNAIVDSTNPRLASLDFSASWFQRFSKNRFLFSPGRNDHLAAAEEAGALWSWRHAEVLFRLLQGRYPYFRQWAEDLVCADQDWIPLYKPTVWAFEQVDHNLFLSADNSDVTFRKGGFIYGAYGVILNVSEFIGYTYYFHAAGSIADALAFLALVDLWKTEPIVRYVYRNTPNEDTVSSNVSEVFIPAMLYFDSGTATAEDELIQKLRIHFGRGGRAALDARAKQNERVYSSGVRSASFWDGHGAVMRRPVCSAITKSRPTNLRVKRKDGNPALRWDAPTYDAEALTGYRILRGAGGGSPEVYVADTGSTNTTWTDGDALTGDLVYIVKALYDGSYASPGSDEVATTVEASPIPALAGPVAFTVMEGDTAVATLMATDGDTPATDLVWSLSGRDQNSFALTSGGDLTFVAAKNFESPDDADGDGTYDLTVTVTDGANSSSADISVALSNRNEAPIANAGAAQEDVEEGATVTLSGLGEDPDADDTLQYTWTQTGGPTVTLSPAATTTFTAPTGLTEDAVLTFTLRVTDAAGLSGEDGTTVTVVAPEPPLRAWIEGVPERHDASTRFTFELRFSEEIRVSYKTLRDAAFEVTGGTVRRARRLAPPSNIGWQITIKPSSDADVGVVLQATTDCSATGAMCTAAGKPLSTRLEATIPGPTPVSPVPPIVSIVAAKSPVPEGRPAMFRLTRTGSTRERLVVHLSLTNSSNPRVKRYRAQIFPGWGGRLILIKKASNASVGDTFTMTVEAGNGYWVSADAAAAQVVVEDDDVPRR